LLVFLLASGDMEPAMLNILFNIFQDKKIM
jgi:hypothetical protein